MQEETKEDLLRKLRQVVRALENTDSKENKEEFTPYTILKPYHKVTFIGYEFTSNGKNIEFEERILPEHLEVREGDMFVVKIDEQKRIILERAEFN